MAVKEQRWMVDSIEEETASVDQGGRMYQVPRFLLPEGVREGDICTVAVDCEKTGKAAVTTIIVDAHATRQAMDKSAAQLASAPRSSDPGGNITL